MVIKYKVSEVAKDLNKPAKQIIDLLAARGGEPKKTASNLDEAELNYIFEHFTKETEEPSLDAYLDSAPKPKPKESEILKKADGTVVEMPTPRHKKKEKKQAEPQGEAQPTETVEAPKREVVTKVVDTRTVDVNLDKFNERYTELAGTKNVENRRKPTPAGNKQKFTNNKNRGRQPFQKRRETEAERLQRIQLEKARKAQLKVQIPDEITVGELASRLKQTASNVIKKLMGLGVMASVSQVVDYDTAAIVAEEFGAKVEKEVHVTIEERLFEVEADNEADLVERPPVVVVMGHVDHGKTSILDAIRKTHVTAGEAGGITQHIGAYQVMSGGKPITFLDTPGHEAFTSMRARGANMTDIAVLVVAADDGIMPQTIESINHAKAAQVSVIVAINKMDKPTANPERVMEQLTQYELVPEQWGGDVICVPVSALTGQGISELLENIALVAEVKELKANPNRRAKGAVVEARLDKGQGPVATILVQNGTLHKGDCIIAGTAVGRVRTMKNDKGQYIEQAGPSTPVEITGLTEVPAAGDLFDAVADEKLARELADQRATEAKERQFSTYQKVTLDNLFSQIAEGERKELDIIVKADVQGSAEAVKQSLEKISNDEVRVKVIHTGVGAVNKSDVMLANASGAIIIGFNVRPDPIAKEEAAQAEVEMRMYRVIYDAINDVTDAMKGMLAPKIREVEQGRLEVRQVYKISSVGLVAGSYVLEGKITRNSKIRVVRDGIVVTEDEIASLRRFKDDVKEVAQGYECGVTLEKFSDIKEGDIFEAYILEEYRD
ncbi:translation initiation factor IF-2 [Gemmiger sp. An120]|uniref:translation initiation factor IF-2 n=1 Tax=Gemmiger sp. An120 TaxID=1965549 RepID=UPI000B394EB1|nr:translation initiation factor IF-2 [Gemmiger sp. An120]OUQ42878.1 translation initiation factor IF-2 [Gemmiger sp. An120]HIX33161.1 translation initiation factor IF-2 [Candidatus Gemmiger avium]